MNPRSVGLGIFLMVITFGLYGIYWFVALTNEVGQMSGDSKFRGGKTILLSMITFGIYSLIWAYKMGANIAKAKTVRGMEGANKGGFYIFLTLIFLSPLVVMFAQRDFNEML
jgi:hypothetical protein